MAIFYPVIREDHFIIPSGYFRTKARPTHGGLDFTPVAQNKPQPVYAVESGRIIIADRTAGPVGDTSGMDVMILTPSGRRWWYGHLSRVDVALNQQVTGGKTIIGMSGTTGSSKTGKASSTGVHLHLELHFPGINIEVDPWPLLKSAPDPTGSKMPLAGSREKARLEYPNYKAPADAPAAAPARPIGDDDNMIVCKQKSTGHVYTVGKQFIRHEERLDTAQYVANVLTFEDTIIDMDDVQFTAILDSHGIPRSAPKGVLRGKLWSVATGITDTRNS